MRKIRFMELQFRMKEIKKNKLPRMSLLSENITLRIFFISYTMKEKPKVKYFEF